MTTREAEDPFVSVQKEVQGTWDAISLEFDRWNLRSSNRSVASRDFFENKVHALEWDLQDMQEAVRVAKQDPSRFRLTPSQVSARERFVSNMSLNVRKVRDALSGGGRDELLGKRAEETRLANDSFIVDQTRQQDQIMEQQDEDLGHLADAVERIGFMGHGMHQELEEQGQLLDELGGELDHTRTRMAKVREKLDVFMAETGPRQFCTIIWLCITFLVLTILVVVT